MIMDVSDINLQEVIRLHPISDPFKEKQKTNSGKIIPYEAIDNNLYKKQASCTCFVTTHKRIHSWVVAIGKGLAATTNTQVQWKSDAVKSEFIVDDTETEDEVAYRIIIYMTTGKILIQGKRYVLWCDEQFAMCLNKVNQWAGHDPSPDTVTRITKANNEITECKEKVGPDDENTIDTTPQQQTDERSNIELTVVPTLPPIGGINGTPTNENTNCKNKTRILPKTPSTNDVETGKAEVPSDSAPSVMTTPTDHPLTDSAPLDSADDISPNHPNTRQNEETNRRLDSIETSIVKLTKAFAEIIAHQHESISNQNTMMVKMKDIKTNPNTTQAASANNKTLKDMEKQIESMKKELKQVEQTHTADIRKLTDEHKKETDKYKREVEELRSKVINGDILNEKLLSKIEASEISAHDLKNSYEARLQDKEKLIQDILSSRHTENDGENWETVNKRNKSYSSATRTDRGSTSSHMNSPGEPTRDKREDSEPPQMRNNPSNPRPTGGIHLIHDSTCKLINVTKLTARAGSNGSRMYAPTIENALEAVNRLPKTETVIIHTGINNLKSQSVDHVVSQYRTLVQQASRKADHLVLSLPIPSLTKPWNDKINQFKRQVENGLRDSPNITLCNNNNFNYYDNPVTRYFADDVHPNEEGTRVLAGNLIRSVFKTKTNQQHSNLYRTRNAQYPNRLAENIARAIKDALGR